MVGRNDLCPCGSGRKYKKCCLAKDEAKEIAKNRISYATTQYDAVIKKIEEFSGQEKYNGLREKCGLDFELKDSELEAINTYYFCDYKYDKQTSILMDYFNAKKEELAEAEKSIIENLRNSYVGVYEVKEKDINKIHLRDVLLDENIYVEDINLFKNFEAGNCVLARILNIGNTKIFLDNTFKIDDNKRDNIIKIINKRYSENKKRFKTKKNCLANNIRFMYKNIVEIYKNNIKKEVAEEPAIKVKEEPVLEVEKIEKVDIEDTGKIENIKDKIEDIDQEAFPQIEEEKAVKEEVLANNEACLTDVNTKDKRVVAARKATHKIKNKVNKKLEEKLNERLAKTKKIQQKKEVNNIPVKEEISENKNLVKIEDKRVDKNPKFKLEECSVYKLLISKVELEYREKCIDIWKRFLEKCENYNGSENGWVSALEYSVRKENDENVTQGQISKKYGVSQKTLGKRYKELQGY